MYKALFLSLFSILIFTSTYAQDYPKTDNPIIDEFSDLIESSNNYQGYKVVDYNDLIKLKNKTSEFISNLNDKIITQQNTIDQQEDEIADLKDELNSTLEDLKVVTAEKDAITFLGMPFSKSGYMTLMWGIIAVLLIALAIFIFQYKRGHSQTAEARNKQIATEKEFEAYRSKALEKEQRLGRLLQDERNKSSDK